MSSFHFPAENYGVDGKRGGACQIEIDESGMRVLAEDHSSIAMVSPDQYIDVRYPGFFTTRSHVEIPLESKDSLQLKLAAAELRQFRTVVDAVLGQEYPHIVLLRLRYHRRMFWVGIVVFLAGVILDYFVFKWIVEFKFLRNLFGAALLIFAPGLGLYMFFDSISEIKRLNRIMKGISK